MRAITLVLLTIAIAFIVATAYTILPSSDKGDMELLAQSIEEAVHMPGRHVFYTNYAVFFKNGKIVVTDGSRIVEREVEDVTLIASNSQGSIVLYSNGSYAWLSNAYNPSSEESGKKHEGGVGNNRGDGRGKPQPPKSETCEVMIVEKFCTQSYPSYYCIYQVVSSCKADRYEVVRDEKVYKSGNMYEAGNYWKGRLNTKGLEDGIYHVIVYDNDFKIGEAPLQVKNSKNKIQP